jgi:hypothetical protein
MAMNKPDQHGQSQRLTAAALGEFFMCERKIIGN